MKRILIITLALALASASLFAVDYDSPVFRPVTPEVTAQGDSFTAVAHGYNSLFTNPAGFARAGGSFTLLSATASPYFIPTEEDVEGLSMLADNPEEAVGMLSDIITTNGFGGAANVGLGIVGKGLGLGVVGGLDFYGRGKTAMGTEIDAAYTWALIAGYAVPLDLGFMNINIGGDVRYMLRAEARDIGIVTFLDLASGTPEFPVYYGSGFGFDAGAIIEMGSLNIGFSARDIGGTVMEYSLETGGDLESIATFDDSNAVAVTDDTFTIPMTLSYGVAFHPDFGLLKWLIDPTFHVEYRDTLYQETEPSMWTKIHAGAEIKVLRFMKVRAGINQGYLTAGVGAKLLFLDVNASYFTREMGEYAGVRPNQGLALEAAIRF
jgi:hypothetical protein